MYKKVVAKDVVYALYHNIKFLDDTVNRISKCHLSLEEREHHFSCVVKLKKTSSQGTTGENIRRGQLVQGIYKARIYFHLEGN